MINEAPNGKNKQNLDMGLEVLESLCPNTQTVNKKLIQAIHCLNTVKTIIYEDNCELPAFVLQNN